MRRWREDVVLVEEEMRRTIEYGYWQAWEWSSRAGTRAGGVDNKLLEGLTAYAQEQEHRELSICEDLNGKKWMRLRELGRAYLAHETVSGPEVVVPIDVDSDVEDEEEGAPDYEDEGDDDLLD
jgi:hypothetical protein